MILITLEAPELAQTLVDYLRSQKIQCQLKQTETGYSVLLNNEAQEEQARAIIATFIRDPFHERYRASSWETGRPAAFKGSMNRSLVMDIALQAQPLVLVITIACGALYLLQALGISVYHWLSFALPWQSMEVWRLFTPVFMHFSILHLLFNLVWWWYLGNRIESQYGTLKLFGVLISAALIPNILQGMISGPTFGGLSGVTYGLLSYLWLREKRSDASTPAVTDGLFMFMMIWIALELMGIIGFSSATTAHLSGLIIGIIQALLDSRPKLSSKKAH